MVFLKLSGAHVGHQIATQRATLHLRKHVRFLEWTTVLCGFSPAARRQATACSKLTALLYLHTHTCMHAHTHVHRFALVPLAKAWTGDLYHVTLFLAKDRERRPRVGRRTPYDTSAVRLTP